MKRLAIAASLLAAAGASAQINSPAPEGYHLRAVDMFTDQNYVGCIDQMQYLKQENPSSALVEDADYYIALSSTHLKRVDSQSLLQYFLWKYPASPRRWEIKLTLAETFLDRNDYASLDKWLSEIDPERLDNLQLPRYRFASAMSALHSGEQHRAASLLKLLTNNPRFGNEARFYQGYIEYVNGDFAAAKDLLAKVDESKNPGSLAKYYLAQIAFAERDFRIASTLAAKLMNDDTIGAPYQAEACRVAGESQYNLGNDAEAVKILNRYLTLTSNPLPSALYILGINAYRNADYSSAISYLTDVAALDNAMGQSALLTIGESLIAQGNYSSAMIALDKAFRMDYDPEIKETALYDYAVARTEGGRVPFGSTVTTFEEFLRLFPNSPYASRIREYIVKGYITDNNLPAALASINAISNPSSEILSAKQLVLYTLGSREIAAGANTQAIAHLTEARNLAKQNREVAAETELWLGDAYFAQGDWNKATSSYLAALKGNHLSEANRPLATYDLAYSYFNAGDYANALQRFAQFVSSSGSSSRPMVADAYSRIGDVHYASSQFTNAADAYAKAIETNPSTGDYPLFQQAMTKGLTANPTGKINDLTSLARRFPESPLIPQSLLEIGLTYDQQRLPDKTIETYSQLAARYPSTPQGREAQLLMALTYLNNGNPGQAIDTYKSLISRAPTSEEAAQAVESLKNIMADEGRIGEFSSFMASVPDAGQPAADDLEATAFAAAERQYLATGTSSRLIDYIEHFPQGANLPQALNYAMKANVAAGNNRRAMAFASRIVTDFPDNSNAADALLVLADTQLAQGMGEDALASYTQLRKSSSSPQLTNSALLGIIHTARDLNRNDLVIEAAEALLASSTPTAEQISEAAFARGQALSLNGDHAAAEAQWKEISSNLDDVNGAKAAFYIAQQQFANGDTDKAKKSVEVLVDSDTPHIYWLARGFILLSDIHRAKGNNFEADQYLKSLRENYPGSESDIINLIDQRLNGK